MAVLVIVTVPVVSTNRTERRRSWTREEGVRWRHLRGPPARNSGRAWVCQIRCPHSGPTTVWAMVTDELVVHGD